MALVLKFSFLTYKMGVCRNLGRKHKAHSDGTFGGKVNEGVMHKVQSGIKKANDASAEPLSWHTGELAPPRA